MIRFIIKVLITSILIATISEVGKRNSLMAAVYASLPLTTILAMVWLYLDSEDVQKTSSLSWNVLLAIIPSCVFLVAFPILVKVGLNFWISLLISAILTAMAYWLYVATMELTFNNLKNMNKHLIVWSILFLIPFSLLAQSSVDKVLSEIEKNNTTLLALQKQAETQKLENKTGIYLKNPEFEFNYLVGNPSGIGNRTDISLKQSFDFPTAYAYKSQIANARNGQVEFEYQKQRKSILLEAKMICIDLIYSNALKAELDKRLEHAQSIAKAYKAKFDIGETNVLEFNKSQLFLLDTKKEMERNDIERNELLSKLASLNGGIAIDFSDNLAQTPVIPNDFEQWYLQVEQSNPVLSWLKQAIEISMKQTKLNKAMGLPKFSVGYMSEKVVGQNFQGVSAGISIPLWENKNTVKQAKAQTIALQSIEVDSKMKFYNQLKAQHAKAISLQKSASDYRLSLESYSNAELLKKALDKGEIALIDYILELSVYNNSIKNLLEAERELNKSVAELNQYL